MDQRVPKEAVWDALLYAAAPYAGKKELEEYYAADPNVVMPEKARKRMNLRIHRERKYREAHESYRPVWIIIQRILLVLLTVLAVMMVAFLPSEKVRAAMWETVLEWGEESILVSFTGGDMTDAPTEILEYREPRGIGEEFERRVLCQTLYKYHVEYNKKDITINYEQGVLSNSQIHISNEETTGTKIMLGKYEGFITEYFLNKDKYINIVWTDEKYTYLLNGNVALVYLQALAESIQ